MVGVVDCGCCKRGEKPQKREERTSRRQVKLIQLGDNKRSRCTASKGTTGKAKFMFHWR